MSDNEFQSETRRRRLKLGIGLLLLVAFAAHVFYWYWPRPVAGLPAADSVAATLLSAEGFDVAVWIPHPHQNLAALSQTVGDRDEFLDAVGRLADVKSPRIPRFGPFPVPPATELGIAVSFDDRRTLLVARVYPAIAFLARWAGRLADNSFLRGGPVDLGGEGALVRWVGNDWYLSTTGVELQDGGVPVPAREVLSLVRVSSDSEVVPRGLYRLEQHDRDLVFRSGQSTVGEDWSPRAVKIDAAFLAVRAREGAKAAIVLLNGPTSDGWPPSVTMDIGGAKRFRLPGERLVGFAGGQALTEQVSGWRVRSLTQESLDSGVELLDPIRGLIYEAVKGGITRALVADVQSTRKLASGFVEKLRDLPVIGDRVDTYWRDVDVVLEPLWGYQRVSVSLAENPPVVEVRLWAVPGAETQPAD